MIEIIHLLQPWFYSLILVVLLIKIVLFAYFKRSQCRFTHFFYAKNSHIVTGATFERVTIRIMQNCLSFYLLFLMSVEIVYWMLNTFQPVNDFTNIVIKHSL